MSLTSNDRFVIGWVLGVAATVATVLLLQSIGAL